jgi:putative transposase
MPRLPRVLVPNGIYHVTARGNRRQQIFADGRDRAFFLRTFEAVVVGLGWRCHAYCLLGNHYHLLVQTPSADLSLGMHRLNSEHAHWFNHRHSVDGHLFQRRFHSVLVESDWHLLELVRYVALNPVRIGLCRNPADWRWSSFRYLAADLRPPRFLAVKDVLAFFGPDPVRARQAILEFVREPTASRSGAF